MIQFFMLLRKTKRPVRWRGVTFGYLLISFFFYEFINFLQLKNRFHFRQILFQTWWFFIARQHTDARYWYSKSVRLSVRNVPVPDENGLTYRHSFFSPHGSPIILFSSASNIFTKFRRGHPLWGAKYRWGIKMQQRSQTSLLFWKSIVNRWNKLPSYTVEAKSVNQFKSALRKLRTTQIGFFLDVSTSA